MDERLAGAMRRVGSDPNPDTVLRAYVELSRAGVYGDPARAVVEAAAEEPEWIFVSHEEVFSGPRSRQPLRREELYAHEDLGLVLSATAVHAFTYFRGQGALNDLARVTIEDMIVRGHFSDALQELSERLGRRYRWAVDRAANASLAPGRESLIRA